MRWPWKRRKPEPTAGGYGLAEWLSAAKPEEVREFLAESGVPECCDTPGDGGFGLIGWADSREENPQ